MSDHGGENGKIGFAQVCFYANEEKAVNRYRRTYSVLNVTVESWWGQMTKIGTEYWAIEFALLEQDGLWTGHEIDRWALRWVYLPLINEDLTRIASDHNLHSIRPQKDRIRPSGKPDDLYNIPESFGGRRCGKRVTEEDIDAVRSALGVENFELPEAVPLAVDEILTEWAARNRIQVTRINAKQIYIEARDLLRVISQLA